MHTHASFYFWSRTTKGLKIWYSFNMILCWKVRDKRLPNKHTHTHKFAHTHTHTHHTHTHTYTHTPTRTWKYGVAYFSIFIWKIEKEREKNVACHDSSKAASKILLQTSSMAFYLLLTSGALLWNIEWLRLVCKRALLVGLFRKEVGLFCCFLQVALFRRTYCCSLQVGLFCRALLLGWICRALLQGPFAGPFCRAFLQGSFAGLFCRALLQ